MCFSSSSNKDFSVFKFETLPALYFESQDGSGQSINLFFYSTFSFKSQAYFHIPPNFKIEMGACTHE